MGTLDVVALNTWLPQGFILPVQTLLVVFVLSGISMYANSDYFRQCRNHLCLHNRAIRLYLFSSPSSICHFLSWLLKWRLFLDRDRNKLFNLQADKRAVNTDVVLKIPYKVVNCVCFPAVLMGSVWGPELDWKWLYRCLKAGYNKFPFLGFALCFKRETKACG